MFHVFDRSPRLGEQGKPDWPTAGDQISWSWHTSFDTRFKEDISVGLTPLSYRSGSLEIRLDQNIPGRGIDDHTHPWTGKERIPGCRSSAWQWQGINPVILQDFSNLKTAQQRCCHVNVTMSAKLGRSPALVLRHWDPTLRNWPRVDGFLLIVVYYSK